MKLLFFSPHKSEVAELSKELKIAGIACEVRRHSGKNHHHSDFGETEIWLQHDCDCHRALLLCVARGIGFARRPAKSSMIESWNDISNGTSVFEEEEVREPVERDTRTGAQRIRKLKAA